VNQLKLIFSSLLLILFSKIAFCQLRFETYKYETNNNFFHLNFSFDIPTDWMLSPENDDGSGYFLRCTTKADFESNGTCSSGFYFKIKYSKNNLDSTLQKMHIQSKSDGMYLTSFKNQIRILIATNISGESFKGIYYSIHDDHVCTDKKNKNVPGDYQFVYFSNERQTLIIETDGQKLGENILNRIINSFKFY